MITQAYCKHPPKVSIVVVVIIIIIINDDVFIMFLLSWRQTADADNNSSASEVMTLWRYKLGYYHCFFILSVV